MYSERLRLLVKDQDGKVHEPVVMATVENASFLKLAAINGMQLVGAIREWEGNV
jgi:hypothetical protein